MINSALNVLYNYIDFLNLWWWSAFNYYDEKSDKLSIYFLCRQNKYTKKKYFRTMRPIGSKNEWIEYIDKIDNVIN